MLCDIGSCHMDTSQHGTVPKRPKSRRDAWVWRVWGPLSGQLAMCALSKSPPPPPSSLLVGLSLGAKSLTGVQLKGKPGLRELVYQSWPAPHSNPPPPSSLETPLSGAARAVDNGWPFLQTANGTQSPAGKPPWGRLLTLWAIFHTRFVAIAFIILPWRHHTPCEKTVSGAD